MLCYSRHGVKLKDDKIRDIKFLSKFVEDKYLPFYTKLFSAQSEMPVEEVGGGQGDDSDPDDPTN